MQPFIISNLFLPASLLVFADGSFVEGVVVLLVLRGRGEVVAPALLVDAEEAEVHLGVLEEQVRLELLDGVRLEVADGAQRAGLGFRGLRRHS